MPYVNQYVDFRNGTIANLGGFSSAQAWFVSDRGQQGSGHSG